MTVEKQQQANVSHYFWTKFGTSDRELVARIPEIIHDSNIKVEVARKGQLSFRH